MLTNKATRPAASCWRRETGRLTRPRPLCLFHSCRHATVNKLFPPCPRPLAVSRYSLLSVACSTRLYGSSQNQKWLYLLWKIFALDYGIYRTVPTVFALTFQWNKWVLRFRRIERSQSFPAPCVINNDCVTCVWRNLYYYSSSQTKVSLSFWSQRGARCILRHSPQFECSRSSVSWRVLYLLTPVVDLSYRKKRILNLEPHHAPPPYIWHR